MRKAFLISLITFLQFLLYQGLAPCLKISEVTLHAQEAQGEQILPSVSLPAEGEQILEKRIDPEEYVVGTGDVLSIDLWGEINLSHQLKITPEGNLVVIGGMNDQGKTSTIDSIAMAFGGKKYIPPKPVRKGAKKATIVAETEDLIITRTMTKDGGGSLKVSTKDGQVHQSPQAVLDALTGQLTFDPLMFSRMKVDKQLETLKELVGLDFTELESKRKTLYDNRSEINTEGKRKVGFLESMTTYPDAPEKEVLVSALMDELEKRRLHNSNIENEIRVLEDYQAETAAQSDHLRIASEEIKKLKAEILTFQRQKDTLERSLKDRCK